MATAESVKAKLEALIAKANETTGNVDSDLTTAVNALVAGFGGGGDGLPAAIAEVEVQTFTPESDTNDELNVSLSMAEAPTHIMILSDYPGALMRSFVSSFAGHPQADSSGDGTVFMSTHVGYIQSGGSHAYMFCTSDSSETNRCGAYNVANTGFTFRGNYYGGQFTYFRAGYTYTIVALRMVAL